MEIGSLSTALFQMQQGAIKVNGFETPTDVGVAVLGKQLDAANASAAGLIRAMELSVQPNIGGNIDTYA
ncbi:MAG: YjfB family protein [bacterium]|nr:YjfB family protein [bacterium]